MGTALPGLSLQPHRGTTRHPPAVGAGRDRTLDPFPSPSCRSPRFAPCAQGRGSIWASVVGHVVLESHENRVGGHRQKRCWFSFCSKGHRSPFTHRGDAELPRSPGR